MARVLSASKPRFGWPDDKVVVLYHVDPGDQEGSFMNATLQSAGDLGFSVATHITLPEHVRSNQRRAAQLIGRICDRMTAAAARNGVTVTFEVQVGRHEEDD